MEDILFWPYAMKEDTGQMSSQTPSSCGWWRNSAQTLFLTIAFNGAITCQ